MSKTYSFLFLIFFFYTATAQNIVIKGTVFDINTQLPLELATVYLSNVKDSTVIEYATTDKSGFFKINTKKYEKHVFLNVNYLGYQSYVEEQNGLLENKDFGKLYLLQNANVLDEVVIKTEAPPIRIKKDTLEYNASSYKVRPDANLEVLLKQLPGFEVDSDGKITVNGKEVTQFLVNGKTFFDKDGAIALKNLPAEIISKVQVSDFKTKKEELSKQESTSDYSSINLTIDEKKNKGYFGKFLAGYGTDDRYESSFIINHFNNKQKISLLASANNINAPGFAQDEVFDSMSGGRNSGGGSSRTTGSGRGITESSMVGLNYNDEWSKKMLSMGSYNFSNSVNKNESKSNQVELSSKGNIFTEAGSETRSENTGNKANFEFEYKLDPTTRIVVTPTVNQSRNNNSSKSFSTSNDEADTLLNESASKSRRESNSTSFGNTINFNKAFERKARNLSFVFSNNNSDGDSESLNMSKTIFYQGTKEDINRDQNGKSSNKSDSYSLDFEYTEPITDSLRIRIGSDFQWDNQINDLKTYDFDAVSQSYSTLNNLQSNYTTSRQNSITPKVGVSFEKNKFTFTLNSSTAIIDYDNHSLYLNQVTDLNQKYILPFGRAQIRYKLDRSKFLTLRYDYSNSLPTYNQLMPVSNLSNPLNTIIGNPFLNPNERNSLNINYRNFDTRTRSGYTFFVRGDYFNSKVVTIARFGDGGQKITEYKNVSGIYTTSAGGNWNQTIKREAHVLRYGFGINGNYSLDKGYTNSVLFDALSLGISPKVNFSYDYGELLTVSPTYSLSYNETKYERNGTSNSSVVHRINIQTTNYWPKNWIFGNDFGYTYNSNLSGNFKKDFYLWNTSLSYGFFDKKMTLKVKVYDVLNQNQSAARSISATITRDEENTVLKRYAMLSLAYKLGSFSGKEKSSRSGTRSREMGSGDGMD